MIVYAITDPQYLDFTNPFKYIDSLSVADFVLYRDKSTHNYSQNARKFLELSRDKTYKIVLHQDYILAAELNVYGVHLTSTQFDAIKSAKELGLYTIISTHNFDELRIAQMEGADAVTFSPIFETPNKGAPKGIERLKEAVAHFDIDIIALGGIVSNEHKEAIERSGAYGFASIRYFVNDI